MNKYILSILVENHSGVLSKMAGLFTRRGYNIDSLTVSITDDPTISRMTIVVSGDEQITEQIVKQLNKLIDVIKILELSPEKSVSREVALIKVTLDQGTRSFIIETVNIFKCNIVEMNAKSIIIEITGNEEKVSSFIELMRPYGIKEVVRTGLAVLQRRSETD
ncbi:acetolactate synthase small subunit [Clostridium estertheticum]|uniref:acetolactate synthase small subunit n=1 Tax=Clostridium estertheticum TaxID=238834 RepID=UPI001CF4A066|nr:acetolactate synthase small subunit [Clostridium estertheticum]MCB2308688.1 acetolactate synthase small subunit [Clostridium estertheticum]MCB2347487.1 acetolactate synthase small subunit [Clostridium estertheticum]MCB2351673.1 acetolactate synthase small subunit [Clostridium estertheticum]WAG45340.1 acetolactate synthase small subunit [Clostridium estertheticum]